MSEIEKEATPQLHAGFWTWFFAGDHSQIVFLGKGPLRNRHETFARVVERPDLRLSWARQVHSATVLRATGEGPCGEGDALITAESHTAVSVATADCVPIVVEGLRHLGVIHAGWRGLASNIIQHTLNALGKPQTVRRAWIGPAVGVCCYEVAADVAEGVAKASDPSVIQDKDPRPHLDLARAAEIQLIRAGIESIHTVAVCTRCSEEWLWSHRRDQSDTGRNWLFAWREKDA